MKINISIFRISLIIAAFIFVPAQVVISQNNQDPPNLPKYDKDPYHFGFQISVNQMFFTINTIENMQDVVFPYSDAVIPDITPSYQPDNNTRWYLRSAQVYSLENAPRLGFTISIVSNLRLAEHFDLRFIPSLAFGERSLVYEIKLNYASTESLLVPDEFLMTTTKKTVTSTFLDFPLYVRYKAKRIQNFAPYVFIGGKYSIDLASEAKKNKDALNNKHIKLYRSDIMGDIGLGFDFYNNWFKLGIEMKMSYGVVDMLRHEDNIYTDVIESLNSKTFTIGFTFE